MKRPILLGLALVAVILPVHFLVSEEMSIRIAALTLALIAGAYIGFAAADGRFSVLMLELVGSTIYAGAALAGLLWSPVLIPVGIMAHAIWDFLHHNHFFGARIPQWYIPLCVAVDVPVGLVLLALYL